MTNSSASDPVLIHVTWSRRYSYLMMAEPPLAGGVKWIDADASRVSTETITGAPGTVVVVALATAEAAPVPTVFNARISTGYSCKPVSGSAGLDEVVVMRSGLSVLPV